MAEERKRVLVVGVLRLPRTAPPRRAGLRRRPLLDALPSLRAFRADLRSGDGLNSLSTSFGQPHEIVNCAAISVPRACEMDPAAAMATNVPSSLVNRLLSFGNGNSLLIHLSTDQVYEGVKSFYKEEDDTLPINMYVKSKVAADKFIVEKCSNYAILRSSIIYGPQTISPVTKSLPIQWMDSVLSQGQEVEFFNDEFCCPVYVKDMVDVILSLTKTWLSDGKKIQVLLNVGGPDRLSRLQMAESVSDVSGYNNTIIKSVSALLALIFSLSWSVA